MRTVVVATLVLLTACGARGGPLVAGPPPDLDAGTVAPASTGPSASGTTPSEDPSTPTATAPTPEAVAQEASPVPQPANTPPTEPRQDRDYASPPTATISGASGSLVMEQGSYCWSQPSGAGLCADTIGPGEQTPRFATTTGETLAVAFETDAQPDEVQLIVWPVEEDAHRTQTELAATNPTTFEVTVEPGSYYAALFTLWDEGDASYHVRLDVGAG